MVRTPVRPGGRIVGRHRTRRAGESQAGDRMGLRGWRRLQAHLRDNGGPGDLCVLPNARLLGSRDSGRCVATDGDSEREVPDELAPDPREIGDGRLVVGRTEDERAKRRVVPVRSVGLFELSPCDGRLVDDHSSQERPASPLAALAAENRDLARRFDRGLGGEIVLVRRAETEVGRDQSGSTRRLEFRSRGGVRKRGSGRSASPRRQRERPPSARLSHMAQLRTRSRRPSSRSLTAGVFHALRPAAGISAQFISPGTTSAATS